MVPDKYITQLVIDIKAACKHKEARNFNLYKDKDEEDMEYDFSDVEGFLSFDEDSSPSLGKVIGLEVIQFPAAEALNENQIIELLSSFIDLLTSYNVSLDLPEELPLHKQYTLAISVLDQSIYLSENGNTTWEFCTQDTSTCPFENHCHCIEFEKEFEKKTQSACQLLKDIVKDCEAMTERHCHMKLLISSVEESEFNLLCIYISNGSENVPYEVYQNPVELQSACDKLKQLFTTDAELISVFEDQKRFVVHSNLEVLLSLKVMKYEENIFYVEPYYVENGRIYKGHSPDYTPEELMRKLEDGEDLLNLREI